MTIVKSTYNFVKAPNEDLVYQSDWAEQISHDIPFSDGKSGEIELTITAETPIFIRNGYAKDKQINEFSHFIDSNGEKQYFIPGSSLKGMIRNVVEIITFSRLNPKLVNDDRYSFRDLSNGSVYMDAYKSKNVRAGWLRENEAGEWSIEECRFAHIHHKEVDKFLGTNFRKEFLNDNPRDKSIKYKYDKVKDKILRTNFEIIQGTNGKKLALLDPNGTTGTIVFTGQSSKRIEPTGKRPSGKVHEFVFFDKQKSTLRVSEQQQKDFKFIYADHDKNNISEAWKYWREQLKGNGRIPVFFTKDNNSIKHFGLAYMYKLPYEHSIHQMFPIANYKNENLDLATAIFGITDSDSGISALKGRVIFGHAINTTTPTLCNEVKEIMASPKASYYPFYLDSSNGKKAYQTKGTLKGFKRYPVQNRVKSGTYSQDQKKNEKIFTSFKPLKEGSRFKTKLRYHNLRPIELGALVSAISFHHQSEEFYHSIGAGKSFGYGKLSIEITGIDQFKEVLQDFEYEMNRFLEKSTSYDSWISSPAVVELYAMASNPSKETEESLVYPSLKNENGHNDFVNYKKNGLYISKYSDQNRPELSPTIEGDYKERKDLEQKKLIEEEDRKRMQESLELDKLLEIAKTFIEKYDFEQAESAIVNVEKFKKIHPLVQHKSQENLNRTLELKKKEYKEMKAYEATIKIDTIEDYDSFLGQYTNSAKKNEIEKKKRLKIERTEQEAFQEAIKTGTLEAYDHFLQLYPNGQKKQQMEEEIRKKKALSGIPENILNK